MGCKHSLGGFEPTFRKGQVIRAKTDMQSRPIKAGQQFVVISSYAVGVKDGVSDVVRFILNDEKIYWKADRFELVS